MSTIEVDGVTIAYEEFGAGPAVVWTGGGWFPRDGWVYYCAGRLSEHHRVILWDRPNSGPSSLVVRDTPSEWHLWCELLHGMCRTLGALPAYFGGGSAGSTLSLLMAHLYPDDTRGIVLHHPADLGNETGRGLIRNWYYVFAEAAEKGGMEEVLRVSANPPEPVWGWISCRVAQNVLANPDNRERLLAVDPQFFARVIRKWGDWALTGGLHRGNLAEEEIARVRVPAIVGPGWDEVHPEHAARDLQRLLPNATWVDLREKWTADLIEKNRARDPYAHAWLYLPFYHEFFKSLEDRSKEGRK